MENSKSDEIFNNIKEKEKITQVSNLFNNINIIIIVKSIKQKYINSPLRFIPI